MSLIRPGRKRALIIIGVLSGVLSLGWFYWWISTAGAGKPAPQVTFSSLSVAASSRALPRLAQSINPALARAVAAVGLYDDGRRKDLNDLDETAESLISQARALLAAIQRHPASGLPMKLPDGTIVRTVSERLPRPGHNPDPQPPLPPPGPEAEVVDGVLIAKSLNGQGRAPIPILGDLEKIVVVRDAWAAIPYDPKLVDGHPLVITNRSGGRYGVSLQVDDCSTVRLNGGLVVPGRFYLLNGTLTIQAAVPVGVLIRPLDTLHGYYEQPLFPPSANG